MIATPAVDLRGGRCVQLVGGRPEDEAVTLPDPVAVALDWVDQGYRALHLVDLDAALGSGDNRAVFGDILDAIPDEIDIQIGGGIRDEAAFEEVLALGPDRLVVGTRAVEDAAWRRSVAEAHPGRLVVAADIRDGDVVTKGWTESSGVDVLDFLRELDDLPLGGILCTDVGREGLMKGIDRAGVRAVVDGTRHPVWVSGGVTTLDELAFLGEIGAYGAVLGMALYTDTLDSRLVAERHGRRTPDGQTPETAPTDQESFA
ncbi:MAG TPA: 1-(5-phosphoribosyl)-5-[(5-phosphoribosylamino)methylideneamino] imidazole-4-carboxamide isomerase [Longimicrobiales bacterium]|nr:1-(5-phosphoribosyl)-5-[(5-phosphoribosylamino)methylideneamino] imidazole-4-carboxamide isomerase [Longimicrobiales bacterium]